MKGNILLITFSIILAYLAYHRNAYSAEAQVQDTPPGQEQEKVDVNLVKEKYWATGEEKELGVVQNRTYSKEKRFSFGLLGGKTFGDPFLSIVSVGATVGYHFNEYFGAHLIWIKHIVSSSDALKTFESTRNATANTNEPKYYLGAEGTASFLYGKLSVLGKKIIYYDFYLAAGGGMTSTETGKYATYSTGVGQRFFITNNVSFKIDYRLFGYREDIKEKVIPNKIGQVVAERTSLNHTIWLAVDFFFGGGAK